MSAAHIELSNHCRVCAEESSELLNIFKIRKKGVLLAEMIWQCTQVPIDPSDGRPSNICKKCLAKLHTSHKFCILTRNSEEKFRQMLSGEEKSFKRPTITVVDVKETILMRKEESDKLEMFEEENVKNEIKAEHDTDLEMEHFFDVGKEQLYQPVVLLDSLDIGESDPHANTKSEFSKRTINRPMQYRSLFEPIQKKRTSSRKIMKLGTDWECYKCKSKFEKFNSLKTHMNEHIDATSHRCTICKMYFSKQTLQKHLCRGMSVRCEYCTDSVEEFTTTVDLLKHLDSHGSQLILNKCSVLRCAELLPMKALLEWHMKEHNKFSFFCGTCSRGFTTAKHLELHEKQHTASNKCKYIAIFSSLRLGLIQMILIIAALCVECGKSFKSASSLDYHLMVHRGEKPFACKRCAMRFTGKRHLLIHEQIHNDMKYACDICQKTFSTVVTMKAHQKKVHENRPRVTCDICHRQYYSNYHLKRHMMIHTGEKPHKCQHCGRAFAQNATLTDHLRIHLGRNVYRCQLCPETFRLKVELRNHSFEHYNKDQTSAADC